MPASARTAPNYDLLWLAFERDMKLLLETATVDLCRAGGDSIEEFAREALTRQGKWLAIQDVLNIIAALKERERDGSLAEEFEDAPD